MGSTRRTAETPVFFEHAGRASLGLGQPKRLSLTWGVAGFRTMWAKLFPIDGGVSEDAFRGRADGLANIL
jgi:hypothetical protein